MKFEQVDKEFVIKMACEWVEDHGPEKMPPLLQSWMRKFKVDYNADVLSKFGGKSTAMLNQHVKFFDRVKKSAKTKNSDIEIQRKWKEKFETPMDQIKVHGKSVMVTCKLTTLMKDLVEATSEELRVSQSDIVRFALYELFGLSEKEKLFDQKVYHAVKGNRTHVKRK